jgi:peptidoglycan-associated lipoprotein
MKNPQGSFTRGRKGKPKRFNVVLRLLSFVFKLLLLVVVAGLSWVGGVALALFNPSSSPQMPFSVRLLGFYEGLTDGGLPLREAMPVVEVPAAPQVGLTEAERVQLLAELRLLQEQLNALMGRTAALEVEVGASGPSEGLESRLDFLAQRLAPQGQAGQVPGVAVRPVFSGDSLMVILPSDVLFEPGGYSLRSGARPILDGLIADLQYYKDSDVRVAAHTDDVGASWDNADLSFLMAEAVAEYLSRGLGDRFYWVVVGYGESRPLTDNDTVFGRQRNRRVEIKINP